MIIAVIGIPALASQTTRPVCFVRSSSSGGGGEARWSLPTTSSVCRSAVAERAPECAHYSNSTGGAVRIARDSRRCAEVWLFALETTSLAVARRCSPRPTRSPSSGSRCHVKIHVCFPSQAATSPCMNIRGRGQPARTGHLCALGWVCRPPLWVWWSSLVGGPISAIRTTSSGRCKGDVV